ncbi:hypothetical protein D9Q98_007090 [Chlorella vulgaris]|uniref:Mechanosensitive ion channel MscS domain-containing protein n=1 Tax=Chlorella vulgaris TaxID=3077 RepID=A0A9D4TJH0_CHLVU|nr:hypothetical protein D9Q98_007090 [Chlorella vulgaris]
MEAMLQQLERSCAQETALLGAQDRVVVGLLADAFQALVHTADDVLAAASSGSTAATFEELPAAQQALKAVLSGLTVDLGVSGGGQASVSAAAAAKMLREEAQPAAGQLASELLATGVPLVEELLKLSSVEAAAWHSLRLLAFLGALALVGTLLLRALGRAGGRRVHDSSLTGRFSVWGSILAAAFRPCKVMMPLYCGTRAATVVLALAEVAATKGGMDPAALLCCHMDQKLLRALGWLTLAAGGDSRQLELLAAMKWATQLMQDCSELVLIVAAAWTLLEFKGRVISWAVSRLQTDTDPHNDGAVPLLRLLSAVLTVAVVMAATAFTLSGFGFHIGPLLASVGGVGVVVGLATQDLLSNIAAAVSLYSTRPFVTNDHVVLVNQEGVEVSGTVLNIEPTRTILLDDENGCIVHISNNGITDYIIRNYTQSRKLSRLQELQAASAIGRGRTTQELVLAIRAGGADEVAANTTASQDQAVECGSGSDEYGAAGGSGVALST